MWWKPEHVNKHLTQKILFYRHVISPAKNSRLCCWIGLFHVLHANPTRTGSLRWNTSFASNTPTWTSISASHIDNRNQTLLNTRLRLQLLHYQECCRCCINKFIWNKSKVGDFYYLALKFQYILSPNLPLYDFVYGIY